MAAPSSFWGMLFFYNILPEINAVRGEPLREPEYLDTNLEVRRTLAPFLSPTERNLFAGKRGFLLSAMGAPKQRSDS
jgi:hypothetical protein